jgi:hypothetical protein
MKRPNEFASPIVSLTRPGHPFALLKELVHNVLERLGKVALYERCAKSGIMEHARGPLTHVTDMTPVIKPT